MTLQFLNDTQRGLRLHHRRPPTFQRVHTHTESHSDTHKDQGSHFPTGSDCRHRRTLSIHANVC